MDDQDFISKMTGGLIDVEGVATPAFIVCFLAYGAFCLFVIELLGS